MKYGFIGCGNMGGALAKALRRSTPDILLSSRTGDTAKALAQQLDCRWAESNAQIAAECDCIFLGVKPQMMEATLAPLLPILQEKKPLLISMAAGLSTQRICQLAGGELPVIRIMPNTPVAVGKGFIAYCCNTLVPEAVLAQVVEDLRFSGELDRIDEKLMDITATVTGCGPAYMYMFVEAIADGAVACGLPRAQALRYAAATMAGAAQMVLETNQHPGALKDAVCSPGGSTIEGVRALEENGFRGTVIDAISAAYQKNQQLGKN